MKTFRRLYVSLVTIATVAFVCAFAPRACAAGGAGNALSFFFGPPDSYVVVPHDPALNAYPLTVTAWIRTDLFAVPLLVAPIVCKSVFSPGWQLSVANGRISASYGASPADYIGATPVGLTGDFINDGQWHHVAFTADASGGRLYLDGVLQTNASWVGNPGPALNNSDINFGKSPGSSTQYEGQVDEITIWNIALSQAEIQANQHRSLTGTEPGLIAYYRCDENVGPTSHDSAAAGGANDGAWFNVSWTPSGAIILSPFAQTSPASAIGATQATLNGVANPSGAPTSAWFEWGVTTNYGNVTPAQSVGSGTSDVGFAQFITGLAAGLTYHFRAVASNEFGVFFGANASFAPPVFTNVNAAVLGLHRGTVTWGDYDNDGFLDALAIGLIDPAATGYTNPVTKLYRYTGSTFTEVATGIPGFTGDTRNGAAAWGDYDNNGTLDIVLTGITNLSASYWLSEVWSNDGAGGFFRVNAGIPGAVSGSVAWGDYDNDGRSDVLLAGWDGNIFGGAGVCEIWRNTGTGFVSANAGMEGIADGAARWGDYDNDGRLDVLAAGHFGGTKIWRNSALGFTNSGIALTSVNEAAVAWGDYDSDGQSDFLLTGFDGVKPVTQLWRNTGNGFTNIPIPGVPGVFFGAVAWGDYDNDGRPDFLLTGATNRAESASFPGLFIPVGYISQLWRNTGTGFANSGVNLPGVFYSSVAWGDYDRDGRLDFALMGATNVTEYGVPAGPITQIWRNIFGATNTVPTPPVGLTVTISNSVAILSWNAAADAQTPINGLTYNVRIGSAPGAADVMSAMAAPGGLRRLPQRGNAAGRLFATFNYTVDSPFYWSVQAVDTAFAGSPFAPEQNFRVLQPAPTLVSATVSNLISGDLDGDGMVDEPELELVLANYYATSPWLLLTNVAGLGGTNVSFALENSTAGAFRVEATTNLVDWLLLGPATPRYEFTDTNAPADPQRYYRLRWP